MENRSYVGDDGRDAPKYVQPESELPQQMTNITLEQPDAQSREKWSRNVEFLLSCVALSVGFGNIWRFPYTALTNGGGAFMIPYLVVLLLVGRPLYYLEMVIGQFSSRGCVKVYDVAPLMRGVGVGQTLSILVILGYYAAILAIAVRYLIVSFMSPLPWAQCAPEWIGCVDSEFKGQVQNASLRPSAEFYFNREVLHMYENLNHGLGMPDWKLVLCLLFCWTCVTVVLIKGIRSSGKASYFLAIFPYVILLVLLIRTCTLDGASEGILYLVTPQWEKLLDVQVWYAAVTQCFFSLTISLGAVIVFSSYNNFNNNIYRDATIISCLDTVTSMIAGIIVFGIMGNLAHITGSDVKSVLRSGPELTFITYPDAIAKFDTAQNVFAVLFFFMFFLLGLGSNTGIVTTILTALRDRYPRLQNWKAVVGISIYGFSCGLIYITPGGLYVLNLVDQFGVQQVTLTLVILEMVTFCWIYGVDRIALDIKLMLGIETGIFFRVCWGFLTILAVFLIWIFSFVQFKAPDVPVGYNVFGWILYGALVGQVLLWALYAILKRPEKEMRQKIKATLQPCNNWGPESQPIFEEYQKLMEKHEMEHSHSGTLLRRVYRRIFS